MPELPDVELYLSALRARIEGRVLEGVRLATPFLLRSVEPPLDQVEGRLVTGFRRIGKRVVWELEGELFLVFHLMIAGRFKWRERAAADPSQGRACGLRCSARNCASDGGSHAETRVAACGARGSCPRLIRSRRARGDDERRRGICGGASEGEPHIETRADRSASVQRHRQRLFR